MSCPIDLHPLNAQVDKYLREGLMPTKIIRWAMTQTPERPITPSAMRKHRRVCLGMPPMHHEVAARMSAPEIPVVPKPTGPKPSEALGRDITEDDIEKRMLRRFYDAIDDIPPDKIAELMIEREKARQKGARPPAKDPDAGVGDPAKALAARIGMAVGARPTKTGVRMRRVK